MFQVTDEALDLSARCYPILAGHGALIQGAALCELVARHLAGHVIMGDKQQTKELRESLLESFITTVKELVPILDEEVIQPQIKAKAQ